MRDKTIIILSVSVGEGHNQVSRALMEELKDRGFHSEMLDIFALMKHSHAQFIKNIYFQMINERKFLWEFVYAVTKIHLLHKLLFPLLLHFFWKDLESYCVKRNIKQIITTHPLATFIGVEIKRKLKNQVKLFAILSDFSTHELCLSPQLDGLFVAEEEEEKRLKKLLANTPVFSYGIPLRKVWDLVYSKREMRKKLQLPFYERIIVLSGGGEGLLPYEKIIRMLERDKRPSYIISFLGVNGQQKRTSYQLKNGSFVQFIPFSTNYFEYVMAADLLISKPGGVTMAEAIRLGVPTVMCSALPGQEKMNEIHLKRKYPAFQSIDDTFCASEFISQYKNTQKESIRMRDARKKIVDKILELSNLLQLEKRIQGLEQDDLNLILNHRKKQSSSS